MFKPDKESFKLTKGLLVQQETPFFKLNSIKQSMRLWGYALGCFVLLKATSTVFFGFANSFSIAAGAFFGGIILSVLTRNIIQFVVGVCVAMLCEHSFEFVQGIL